MNTAQRLGLVLPYVVIAEYAVLVLVHSSIQVLYLGSGLDVKNYLQSCFYLFGQHLMYKRHRN